MPNTELVSGVFEITGQSGDGRKYYRTYLFTEGVPTLIDTGKPDTSDEIIEGIHDVGVSPERIIVTHGDSDHIGGFDAIHGAFDLESWVPEQTEVKTETSPSNRYGNGDAIGRFVAVHTPGHEPDNHALVDEEAGIVVLGDAASGSDRRGLPAGYFTLPPRSVDLNLAMGSLRALLDYDFETALVFHGTSVLEDAYGKLDRYVNPS